MQPFADPFVPLSRLPGVFEAVDAARGSVDALLRELRVPEVRPLVVEVTAEAVRIGAWASAALDGREGPLETFVAPVADRFGAGALRLGAELSSLAGAWSAAPLQAMARMHVLSAAGGVDEAELGRPVSVESAARLEGLSEVVSRPTAAPAVVVAAIVQGEVLAVQAFGAESGLVARAASRCVLMTRGVDPRAASIPELGHLEQGKEKYERALAGYRSGSTEGVVEWIVHCAQAVALGGQAGRRVSADVRAALRTGGRSAATNRQSG